jgi:hypothetical protein
MKRYRWCWGVLSIIPNTDLHYFLGDWDNMKPQFKNRFKTPHGWHGVGIAFQRSFKELISEMEFFKCDPEFIKMTEKRGYATLEFKTKKEVNYWRDKACVLVKFQRVESS